MQDKLNKIKNCMFQYATKNKVIEDTGLITIEEAEALWTKYQDNIRENWDAYDAPQMCIWIDCDTDTDYSTIAKEIYYWDCILENGKFYKVTKQLIK